MRISSATEGQQGEGSSIICMNKLNIQQDSVISFPSVKMQNISGAKIQSRKEHLSSPCYITALRPSAAVWIRWMLAE